MTNTHYFECDCHSDEHTIRFTYNDTDNELYLSVFLGQFRPWWKRIIVAVGYVFGYKCRYGHWDCWIMQADDAGRLKAVLSKVHHE